MRRTSSSATSSPNRRTVHLLEEIDQALETSDLIIVPWGAMHLPEIEASLLSQGFVATDLTARPRVSILAIVEADKRRIARMTQMTKAVSRENATPSVLSVQSAGSFVFLTFPTTSTVEGYEEM